MITKQDVETAQKTWAEAVMATGAATGVKVGPAHYDHWRIGHRAVETTVEPFGKQCDLVCIAQTVAILWPVKDRGRGREYGDVQAAAPRGLQRQHPVVGCGQPLNMQRFWRQKRAAICRDGQLRIRHLCSEARCEIDEPLRIDGPARQQHQPAAAGEWAPALRIIGAAQSAVPIQIDPRGKAPVGLRCKAVRVVEAAHAQTALNL